MQQDSYVSINMGCDPFRRDGERRPCCNCETAASAHVTQLHQDSWVSQPAQYPTPSPYAPAVNMMGASNDTKSPSQPAGQFSHALQAGQTGGRFPVTCPVLQYVLLIPQFGGDEESPQEALQDFLTIMNTVAVSAGWSDADCLRAARIRISGTAKRLLRDHPADAQSWQAMEAFLREFFFTKPSIASLERELSNCAQGAHESLRAYVERVHHVTRQMRELVPTYSEGPTGSEFDRRVRDIFILGLRQELRTLVRRAKPNSFAEAVRVAKDEEQYIRDEFTVSHYLAQSQQTYANQIYPLAQHPHCATPQHGYGQSHTPTPVFPNFQNLSSASAIATQHARPTPAVVHPAYFSHYAARPTSGVSQPSAHCRRDASPPLGQSPPVPANIKHTQQVRSTSSYRRKGKPFSGKCFNCDEEGHHFRECPTRSCALCSAVGHVQAECTRPKNGVALVGTNQSP